MFCVFSHIQYSLAPSEISEHVSGPMSPAVSTLCECTLLYL